jgi:hypothetical protein
MLSAAQGCPTRRRRGHGWSSPWLAELCTLRECGEGRRLAKSGHGGLDRFCILHLTRPLKPGGPHIRNRPSGPTLACLAGEEEGRRFLMQPALPPKRPRTRPAFADSTARPPYHPAVESSVAHRLPGAVLSASSEHCLACRLRPTPHHHTTLYYTTPHHTLLHHTGPVKHPPSRSFAVHCACCDGM